MINKRSIIAAMELAGFENWRPPVDVTELNRPFRRPADLTGEGRLAAVLLLLYPNLGSDQLTEVNLVLTRRHAKLKKHAGQISFPGGSQDKGESLEATALRETAEEIGVPAKEIHLLGQLNPVYIPPSDFTVTPFAGWLDQRPEFVRAEDEVDEIIEVPLSHLLKPESLTRGEFRMADGSRKLVPFYRVDDHRVWGATAIILGELIERVRRASAE